MCCSDVLGLYVCTKVAVDTAVAYGAARSAARTGLEFVIERSSHAFDFRDDGHEVGGNLLPVDGHLGVHRAAQTKSLAVPFVVFEVVPDLQRR